MLKCPIVVLALLLYCGGNRESCREQKIVIWKIDCHFVIDDKMSNIIELYGMHKRYERREGARENERKRCERSGLGGVGVAFWEGQTSRGQECTFSSFARSPSEYKFATLSSWRGRYPPSAWVFWHGWCTWGQHRHFDWMDFEFLPPPSTPNPNNSITNLFIAMENHCQFIRHVEGRTTSRYFWEFLVFPYEHISLKSDFRWRQVLPFTFQ